MQTFGNGKRASVRKRLGVACLGVTLAAGAFVLSIRVPSSAARPKQSTAATSVASHPAFDGFWEVYRGAGGGGRGRGPGAKLTPKAIEHEKRVAAERAAG